MRENSCNFSGYLGNDVKEGKPYGKDDKPKSIPYSFSIPLPTPKKDEDTTWINFTIWVAESATKVREFLNNNLKKGRYVVISNARFDGASLYTNEKGENFITNNFTITDSVNNLDVLEVVPHKTNSGEGNTTAATSSSTPAPTETEVQQQIASAPATDTGLPWA